MIGANVQSRKGTSMSALQKRERSISFSGILEEGESRVRDKREAVTMVGWMEGFHTGLG